MSLIAISYPELETKDMNWIESIRKEHEENYSFIRPHFTLVFETEGISPDDFKLHVREIARTTPPIRFTLRSTVVVTDRNNSRTFVLLVPEEGHSRISRLHDLLYGGILDGTQRLDMPYIPHITVGNSTDVQEIVDLAKRLNANEFAVEGVISSIDVADFEPGSVRSLCKIELATE